MREILIGEYISSQRKKQSIILCRSSLQGIPCKLRPAPVRKTKPALPKEGRFLRCCYFIPAVMMAIL